MKMKNIVAVRYAIRSDRFPSGDSHEESCESLAEARAIIIAANYYLSYTGEWVSKALLVYDNGTTENLR